MLPKRSHRVFPSWYLVKFFVFPQHTLESVKGRKENLKRVYSSTWSACGSLGDFNRRAFFKLARTRVLVPYKGAPGGNVWLLRLQLVLLPFYGENLLFLRWSVRRLIVVYWIWVILETSTTRFARDQDRVVPKILSENCINPAVTRQISFRIKYIFTGLPRPRRYERRFTSR